MSSISISTNNNDNNMTNEENVVVAVRIRPPLEREINRKTGYNSCIGLQRKDVFVMKKDVPVLIDETGKLLSSQDPSALERFRFDHTFGSDVNTATVYKTICKDTIPSILDGKNQTIFAYGQTGSGKTHTMFGPGWDEEDTIENIVNNTDNNSNNINDLGDTLVYTIRIQNIGNVSLSGLTVTDTLTDANSQPLTLTSQPSSSSSITAITQKGADIDGEAAGDGSGKVSINSNGNIVAISAPNNDGNGSDSGHVRVYSWNGSSWAQRGSDINGEATGDLSGESIATNDAGDVVIIGASNNTGANGSSSGHACVWVWNGNSWVQKGSDLDGDSQGDGFGAVSYTHLRAHET